MRLNDSLNDVLVVDGNMDYRRFVSIVLRSGGYSVVVADDVEKGIEIACSRDLKAIIADVESEDGKGEQLLQQVKLRRPDIPVAILTCADISATKVKALGASKFMRKPVDSSVLLEAVRDL